MGWKNPPNQGGRSGRVYYVTQAGSRPPTFVFFVNDPKARERANLGAFTSRTDAHSQQIQLLEIAYWSPFSDAPLICAMIIFFPGVVPSVAPFRFAAAEMLCPFPFPAQLFPESYLRYLERALRENVGFKGTPIKLLLRGKAVLGTKAQAGTNESTGRV